MSEILNTFYEKLGHTQQSADQLLAKQQKEYHQILELSGGVLSPGNVMELLPYIECEQILNRSEIEKLLEEFGNKRRECVLPSMIKNIYFWSKRLSPEAIQRNVAWIIEQVEMMNRHRPEESAILARHLDAYLPYILPESLPALREIISRHNLHLIVSSVLTPEEIKRLQLPTLQVMDENYNPQILQTDKIHRANRVNKYTGTCVDAETLHYQTLEQNQSNFELGQYTIIHIEGEPVGSIKNYTMGGSSLVSWRTVQDEQERHILKKGGLYVVDSEVIDQVRQMGKKNRTVLDIPSLKVMPIRMLGSIHSGDRLTIDIFDQAIDSNLAGYLETVSVLS